MFCHVRQVCIASSALLVVSEHGVDGFSELRAAIFVDAASVYPNPLKPVFRRLSTAILDLGEAFHLRGLVDIVNVIESDLLLVPSMRQNCVIRDMFVEKFLLRESV